MKPDKEGIWEWFDEEGTKHLVDVVNVEHDFRYPKYLRVNWGGGYYNINDESIGEIDEIHCKSEWPDRWGNYVGTRDEVEESLIYGNS